MNRFAILGGSFDPPHLGHLSCAIAAKELGGFDRVFMMPAYQNPHKAKSTASPQDRLAMLKLLITDIEGLDIFDFELFRIGPSYTIDSLDAFFLQYKVIPTLLIGQDNASSLDTWKEAARLKMTYPMTVLARPPFQEKSVNFLPIPQMEISSSDVRKRLKLKLCCQHLVRANVLDYIAEHELY